MNLAAIHDADIPGLALVTGGRPFLDVLAHAQDASGRAFGRARDMRIIRMRHRPGERAVLQVEFSTEVTGRDRPVPASIWLYQLSKARKRALKAFDDPDVPSPYFEPQSGALVYLFPNDPHMPQIARFLEAPDAFAGRLLPDGAAAFGDPWLVRFRPGLGATFRWPVGGVDAVYVKIQNETPAPEALEALRQLGDASRNTRFGVPEAIGIDEAIGALSMHEVRGPTYAEILADGHLTEQYTVQLLRSLDDVHTCRFAPARTKGRAHFVERALGAAALVARAMPELAGDAGNLAAEISATPVALRTAPCHCDIKLEHAVFSGAKTVLIDIDSFALSDPLYDLAMLDMRLAMFAHSGGCAPDIALATGRMIRIAAAGRPEADALLRFGWLKACAALQLARHFAQNPGPQSARLAALALETGQSAIELAMDRTGDSPKPTFPHLSPMELPPCA